MTLMTTTITPADLSTDLAPVEHEGQQLFDARTLHARLGVGGRYATWITRRIKEYDFHEAEDYFPILGSNAQRGQPRKDHLLTLGMAKELAMVERTEQGRIIRRYFIEMEKAARDMASTLIQQGQAHAIPQSFFSAQEALAMEQRLLEAIQKALPGKKEQDYWTILSVRVAPDFCPILSKNGERGAGQGKSTSSPSTWRRLATLDKPHKPM